MNIVKIENKTEKSRICETVLRSLPQWFGIESAILDYIKDVQRMETWAAIESDAVGFLSLNKHNQRTAEIHVMGILPEYQGKKIGTDLVRMAVESLVSQGFQFLTVKTLSESRPDENYDQTRHFYLRSGFTPIEEFKTLWGEHNPCLMMLKSIGPQKYAVIFSSKRSEQDHEEYERASQQMLDLARSQRGFLGVESSRDANGFGITISYWRTLDDIHEWKLNAAHLEVQKLGRSRWYDSFTTTICKVEQEYNFEKAHK